MAVDDDGRTLIAATLIRDREESGNFGEPIVAGVSPSGTPGRLVGPVLDDPSRAFGPTAAFRGGGRSVLVFGLTSSARPFESRAPVGAVAITADGRAGRLQTLTSGRAKEPVVTALSPGRTIVMWSGARGLGASYGGSNGRFAKTSTPKGPPPPPFHSNSTNRDLRTAGRYAIFTWSRERDGRVRVSIRRF